MTVRLYIESLRIIPFFRAEGDIAARCGRAARYAENIGRTQCGFDIIQSLRKSSAYQFLFYYIALGILCTGRLILRLRILNSS